MRAGFGSVIVVINYLIQAFIFFLETKSELTIVC